jgi:hypothetical protein
MVEFIMSRPQKPKGWQGRLKRRSAGHYALFKDDLPFGHKVEEDKTKVIDRKRKHKSKNIDDD